MDEGPSIEVAGLQLQPPIQGEEKLFGWYPPAYPTFSKPNYKQFSSYGPTKLRPLGQIQQPKEEAHYRHHASLLHNAPGSEAFSRPPTIMSSRCTSRVGSSASGANLSAKMDGIRQELRRRQLDSPMLRRLTAQQSSERPREVFNYQSERVTQRPVFTAVPSAFRAARCPEPDLRYCWSPAQTRSEASRPSTASSVAIPSPAVPSASATARDDRPVTPTPAAAPPTDRRPSPAASVGSTARRNRRPQTAPALMKQPTPSPVAKETPAQRMAPSATEMTPPLQPTPEAAPEVKEEAAEVAAEAAAAAATPIPEIQEEQTAEGLLEDAYDKALKIQGWKMEVPGDPLGLKSKYLAKRLPCTVKVSEPEVKALPPRMRVANRETFFQRTIPKQVFTFDIHPDFPSERYNAKRQELQRKGKWDYAYRDFSFVY